MTPEEILMKLWHAKNANELKVKIEQYPSVFQIEEAMKEYAKQEVEAELRTQDEQDKAIKSLCQRITDRAYKDHFGE